MLHGKMAMDALTEIGGTSLEHPPYSQNLAPVRFLGFLNHEKGASRSKSVSFTIFLKLAANGLQHVFEEVGGAL
jgi:hypothetical protein